MTTQAQATKPPRPHPGFFLALEGPDGGGKSTQAARAADWLRGLGFDVVACRDPGGTALGERLREVVLSDESVRPSMRAEMLLYMASRAQLVDEVIRPALTAGRIVVSDRFLLSNLVYQGTAGGLDVAVIAAIGAAATDGLVPDLTLILDVPPDVARERTGPARDRIERRPADYQAKVRAGFLDAPAVYHAASVVIDAGAGPDEVFAAVQREVGRALALDPRP